MEIKKVLEEHVLWLTNQGGKRANLWGANLWGANLWGANLERANLERANLWGANLERANLERANLWGANLWGANLERANLERANLERANLERANLERANLERANLERANLERADLWGANLRGANLEGANLPDYQICPQEGEFVGWKKTTKGAVKLLITGKRTSSLIGRKLRCSECRVIDGPGIGGMDSHSNTIKYEKGAIITPDSYDDDIRVECTHGIHFFITKEEAEAW